MLENILTRKGFTSRSQLKIKTAVTSGIILLAVLLPQLVHFAFGANGGMRLLPMYLPILLGSCILGVKWGTLMGVAAPLLSFAVTSLFGNAMPAAARLPYMVAELVMFAVISGVFSKKISQNTLWAFASVMLAFVFGRALFVIMSAFAGNADIAFAQVKMSLEGVAAQMMTVPLAVLILKKLTAEDNSND